MHALTPRITGALAAMLLGAASATGLQGVDMAHDKREPKQPRMPRMSRHTLRKRAARNVDQYETPTHELDAAAARWRVLSAWIQGYDAARSDLRAHRLKRRK